MDICRPRHSNAGERTGSAVARSPPHRHPGRVTQHDLVGGTVCQLRLSGGSFSFLVIWAYNDWPACVVYHGNLKSRIKVFHGELKGSSLLPVLPSLLCLHPPAHFCFRNPVDGTGVALLCSTTGACRGGTSCNISRCCVGNNRLCPPWVELTVGVMWSAAGQAFSGVTLGRGYVWSLL